MRHHAVVVHKDKETREIKTYTRLDGLGAEMALPDFISLMAEKFGSPAMTMTRAMLLKKLQDAAHAAIMDMKMATKEVAAINLEPKPRPGG